MAHRLGTVHHSQKDWNHLLLRAPYQSPDSPCYQVKSAHASKILLHILLKLMEGVADTEFAEEQMGFRKKVKISNVRILMEKASESNAAVRVEEELTDWFEVTKGVRQGCLVSPICFNFYSEAVMRESAGELSWIGVNISGKTINDLRFADDIGLIATSPERLQELLDLENTVSMEYSLEISTKKTKVMATTNNRKY
ncbi:Hypp4491 [Branchiostoma lanceolatum]|uniref:Hypp4491 protein n=1 Tax=Branchiostoma lanceolatum TaxID=7740 RepID=A0A8K0ADT9_BRALA|nr:Hypp4491 [Branchiostoma lanceolatum]